MAQSVIGALRVTMGLDTAQFDKGIKQAQGRLGGLRQNFGGLAAGAAAAAAASLGVVAVKIREVSKQADEMIKAGRGLGLTVEQLSRLKVGADRSGISFEQLMTSLRTFNRSVADLAAGETNTAAEALRRLGIEARNVDGSMKDTRQLLGEVADRFQDLPPGIERSNIAMEIFGSRNAAMVNMLAQGSDGLREFDREADTLGLTLSTEMAQSAEQFNDNMDRIGSNLDRLWIKIANATIPILAELSESFLDLNEMTLEGLRGELSDVEQKAERARKSLERARQDRAQYGDGILGQQAQDRVERQERALEAIAGREQDINKQIERRLKLEEEMERRRKARENRRTAFRLPPIINTGDSGGSGSSLGRVGFTRGSLPSLFSDDGGRSALGVNIDAAKSGMEDLEKLSIAVGNTMADRFADAFTTAIQSAESFSDALRSTAMAAISTIARELIRNGLAGGGGVGGGGLLGSVFSSIGPFFGLGNSLGGGFSIGSGGASLSAGASGLGLGSTLSGGGGGFSFLSGIGGFRTGGAFDVGGYGGPDSEVVAFRASPGEHVSIDRDGGGGRSGMHISVDVSGANGDAEIEKRVQRGVAEGLKQYDQRLPGRILDVQRRHY